MKKVHVRLTVLALLLVSIALLSMTQSTTAVSPTGELAPRAFFPIIIIPDAPQELLVYDWNENVTTSDRGFPRNQPPMENDDWTQPINYADGTFHFRAQIFSQPVPQDGMHLQWCVWQRKNSSNFGLETCGPLENVPGTSGTVVCWSREIAEMWQKDNNPIEWERPRYRVAVAIKNEDRLPVSDYNGWEWNGENPAHWYPLNMRFTVIVVAEGATFTGWSNYGGCP